MFLNQHSVEGQTTVVKRASRKMKVLRFQNYGQIFLWRDNKEKPDDRKIPALGKYPTVRGLNLFLIYSVPVSLI